MAVVMPIPFYFASMAPWVALCTILGLAQAMGLTPLYPLVADSVNLSDQGTAYGLVNWMFCVGYMLGPWLGGTLAEVSSLRMPFFLSSAILIAGVVSILFTTGTKPFLHKPP